MEVPVHVLERLTSPEIAAAIAAGCTRALVPCGAIEQHGPHLALRMDTDHAEALAPLIAKGLGGAFIAPSIAVGCSSHHLAFSGTISLSEATFAAICRDYCTSLLRHGITEIFFYSGHVGNFPVLENALPGLRQAVPGARVEAFTDSTAWLTCWAEAVAAAGGSAASVGGHADIAETSLMLHIKPEAVRPSRIEAGRPGLMTRAELDIMWRDGLPAVSPNGILGDARGASAGIGAACLTAIAGLILAEFTAKA
ncbi:creatininase family protein [Pararhodobacter aggregans]|uniref:creatininase family protein n=1 Tax=Pararhodobacter aggregans TaxID=404875 RepID=UPI003A928A02